MCLMRYAVANLLFRLRFPSGSLAGCDFRPHFDGHLLNATVCIPAGLDAPTTEAVLARRLRQSFQWVRFLRVLLRPGDRVQFCLGTLRPRQQYLKAWSTRGDLTAGTPPHGITHYWSRGTPAGT